MIGYSYPKQWLPSTSFETNEMQMNAIMYLSKLHIHKVNPAL